MKKILVIFVALIGFSVSDTNANFNGTCNRCKCDCGTELRWHQQAYQTEQMCWNCHGTGKDKVHCNNCVDCTECNRTGKQKCNSNDGRNRYDRWTHCRDCSVCGGDGRRNGIEYIDCSKCSGKGKQYVWQSGCKCPRCGNSYTGCN